MSDNLALTQLVQSQANKEVTINDQAAQLDAALTDLVLIDLTGATSPLVLTSGQALRAMVLKLTGTNPGAPFVIEVPTNRKLYVVWNISGNAVEVRVGGGSGVTVGDGELRLVYADGADVLPIAGGTGGANDDLDTLEAVRAVATSALTLGTDVGAGEVVDGVTLAAGDRVLLTAQADASENGVYVVAASGPPSRTSDFDDGADLQRGVLVPVLEGTTEAATLWMMTTAPPHTVGTTDLAFAKVSGASSGGGSTVKVTSADTTASYLLDKLTAGANTTLTRLDAGGDEHLEIASSGVGTATFIGRFGDPDYAIDTAGYSDAGSGYSDEFDDDTLAAHWTAVNMVAGTVDLIDPPASNAVYDLVTRPGTMFVQGQDGSGSSHGLRLEALPGDGEQYVLAVGIGGNDTTGNNNNQIGFSLNDNDSNPTDGTQVMYDGDSNGQVIVYDGSTVITVQNSGVVGRRMYFRLVNVAGTYYCMISVNGAVWRVIHAVTGSFDHFWIKFQCGGGPDHQGVNQVYWFRHTAYSGHDPFDATPQGDRAFTGFARCLNDTSTADGSETVFPLTFQPEGVAQVWIDGLLQDEDDYSVLGTTLIFDTPPPNGSHVIVYDTGYTGETRPYDLPASIPGTRGDGALLFEAVFTRDVTFPDDFAGSRLFARTAATAPTVLHIEKNGSVIGTITVAASGTTGTFATTGGAATFAAGDRLAIVNEDPADDTLADLAITLQGTRQ